MPSPPPRSPGPSGRIGRPPASTDPPIAPVAALIGDPSRAAILLALAGGQALPAGELARAARVSPQTASAHLDKLFRARLLAVEVRGRHHYFRLRDARVAQLLEALAALAPPRPSAPAALDDGARALRLARFCYDHLAGSLGVAVTAALCERGYLAEGDDGYAVTAEGWAWLDRLGIDRETLRASRRPLTRRCLDWSERRYHLAGLVGATLAGHFLDRGWVARVRQSRAVRLTDSGRAALRAHLGAAAAFQSRTGAPLCP